MKDKSKTTGGERENMRAPSLFYFLNELECPQLSQPRPYCDCFDWVKCNTANKLEESAFEHNALGRSLYY